MATTFIFDYEICPRCCGTGSHSFNLMHGSRCYGCSGHGNRLTKRGRAAQAYFNKIASKPAAEFKPGELLRDTDVTVSGATFTAFYRVVSVEVDGERCKLELTRKSGNLTHFTSATTMYRRGLSADEKQALVVAALDYEATLTKQGKVRAKALKEAA